MRETSIKSSTSRFKWAVCRAITSVAHLRSSGWSVRSNSMAPATAESGFLETRARAWRGGDPCAGRLPQRGDFLFGQPQRVGGFVNVRPRAEPARHPAIVRLARRDVREMPAILVRMAIPEAAE